MSPAREQNGAQALYREIADRDERLDQHEQRIDAMTTGQHQLAMQIAELTLSMQGMRREIPKLMAEGIRQAVSDPSLWEAAGKAMRDQAHLTAGGWLIGGLRTIANRGMWIAVLLGAIYLTGGWTAVVATFKAWRP